MTKTPQDTEGSFSSGGWTGRPVPQMELLGWPGGAGACFTHIRKHERPPTECSSPRKVRGGLSSSQQVTPIPGATMRDLPSAVEMEVSCTGQSITATGERDPRSQFSTKELFNRPLLPKAPRWRLKLGNRFRRGHQPWKTQMGIPAGGGPAQELGTSQPTMAHPFPSGPLLCFCCIRV